MCIWMVAARIYEGGGIVRGLFGRRAALSLYRSIYYIYLYRFVVINGKIGIHLSYLKIYSSVKRTNVRVLYQKNGRRGLQILETVT